MSKDMKINGRPERLNIVRVAPFGEITIHAPGGDVDLLLIVDPITKGVFAVESSYMDKKREQVSSPYASAGDELIIDTKGIELIKCDICELTYAYNRFEEEFVCKNCGEPLEEVKRMVEHDDMLDERMAEAGSNIDVPKSGQSNLISQWTVKDLTRDNIETIAQQLGIPMERINDNVINDIVHSVRKGVDAALENWDEIVRLAIRESVPDKDDESDMTGNSFIKKQAI